MPELPEVETIKNDLKAKVVGETFVEAKTDWAKIVKERDFEEFSRHVAGKTIEDVQRRGKNIVITLSEGKTLLVHLKMTGHLIVADRSTPIVNAKWIATPGHPLAEPQNQFIHLVFYFESGRVLALSDLRKFANVRLVATEKVPEILKGLGPEPLGPDFTFERFKETLRGHKTSVKKVLMDQNVIAGIGNIYADEILFDAKVHPGTPTAELTQDQAKHIYRAIPKVLKEAIELRGTSISDFRDTGGEKGTYGDVRRVYQQKGNPCPVCGTTIERTKLGGRGTHFCPHCQKP